MPIPVWDPFQGIPFQSFTVFGWTYDNTIDPSGTYTYAKLGDQVVAGLRSAQPDQPPAWTLYLSTADAAGTAKRATQLGGTVVYEAEAPGQGDFLFSIDPAGAMFGAWRQRGDWEFGLGQPNTLVWSELSTADGAGADTFYASLFGYAQQQIGDGVNYDYTVWSLDEVPLMGRRLLDSNGIPPQWLVYFGVDPHLGTDELVARVVGAGGSIIAEPADIPAGRIAVLQDPEGASFAVVDQSRRTQ